MNSLNPEEEEVKTAEKAREAEDEALINNDIDYISYRLDILYSFIEYLIGESENAPPLNERETEELKPDRSKTNGIL